MERPSYETVHLNNPLFQQRTGLFESYPTARASIVMLGDSITQAPDWAELLQRPDIVNRGIGSDTTFGFLDRIHQIVRLRPLLCCVMGGINDLYEGVPPEVVAANHQRIAGFLVSAGIGVLLQSTLHVSPLWNRWEEKNLEVVALNSNLRRLAKEPGVEFLDLNALLSSERRLRAENTYDGIHLTTAAYQTWKEALIPVLKRRGV